MDSADLDVSIQNQSCGITVKQLERLVFWSSVLAAGALMWLAPLLPGADLPEHAGQVALWRDLIRGTSLWSNLVYINLLTPYLIGYGLALPLSFLMSPEAAISVVLTGAFYAFVVGCVALRKELRGDERLDWLFIIGFFGYNWDWGFYTYLVASPVLILFLLLVVRYRRSPNFERGALVTAVGIALLFSHGLLYLFGLFAACLLLCGELREPIRARAKRLTPLAVLSTLLVVFAFVTHERGTAVQITKTIFGTPIWLRPLTALTSISGAGFDLNPILTMLTVVALSTPFFIGCRLNRGAPLALFAALCATFLLLPDYAFGAAFLYARFALFLPAFFAFLFVPKESSAAAQSGERAARLAMIIICIAVLCVHGRRLWDFRSESQSFVQVERAAAPGHRALGLVLDYRSRAAHSDIAYLHFPSWYQADRGGFVDFNFASYDPQVVRFKPVYQAKIGQDISLTAVNFNWAKDKGWAYDYFFIRGASDALAWLRARSPCELSFVAASGSWSLLHKDSCPGGPNAG